VRHVRLLEWFEVLAPGVKPRARVEVWPRGGAKSSTGELGVVRLGAREVEWQTERADEDGSVRRVVEVRPPRRFVLYVSGTQNQANKHLAAIEIKFEQLGVPPLVGAYGNSKGWKVDLLRTSNGFNVLALGLDAAARGLKLDDFRPDLIIFDDIDSRHDSPDVVEKKIETITDSILPAGSTDCAVLFLQNKIHKNSVVSQLCDGRAKFLLTREPAKVEPAMRDLEIEQSETATGLYVYRITGGEATWEGQDIETCQGQINEWGRAAFMREAQHKVDDVEDGLWQRERDINPHRFTRAQLNRIQLLRVGVAVDPSIGSKGDEVGIIGGGIGLINGVLHGFVWEDKSKHATPKAWVQDAVNLYHSMQADVFLYEGNFFKQIVEDLLSTVDDAPPATPVYVYRNKIIRAEPIQKLFEDGRVHIVGSLSELETQLCTYKPGDESPGRMDALVILLSELMLREGTTSMTKEAFEELFG